MFENIILVFSDRLGKPLLETMIKFGLFKNPWGMYFPEGMSKLSSKFRSISQLGSWNRKRVFMKSNVLEFLLHNIVWDILECLVKSKNW